MIRIKEVRLNSSYSVNFVVIDITLYDTTEDLSNYEINILRSITGHDDGEYEYILKDIDRLTVRDMTASTMSSEINYYYRVEVVNKITGEKSLSGTAVLTDRTPDNYGQYFVDVEDLYLDRVIGGTNDDYNSMVLFSVKKTGQHCPKCYDPVRGRSQNQNCPICYGTSIKGGYYAPVRIKVNFINPNQRSEAFQPSGVGTDINATSAWTKNYPVINIRDVLVDSNNRRFVVGGVQESRKGHFVIRQSLNMYELPKNSPVYRLGIGEGLYEY